MKNNECKIEWEVAEPACATLLQIDLTLAETREDAAFYVRKQGYRVHVGGRHVAVIGERGVRLAIITGTGKDWN